MGASLMASAVAANLFRDSRPPREEEEEEEWLNSLSLITCKK